MRNSAFWRVSLEVNLSSASSRRQLPVRSYHAATPGFCFSLDARATVTHDIEYEWALAKRFLRDAGSEHAAFERCMQLVIESRDREDHVAAQMYRTTCQWMMRKGWNIKAKAEGT